MQTVIAMVGLGWRQIARDRFALAATFLLPVLVGALMVSIYEAEDPDVRPIQLGVLSEVAADESHAVSENIVGHLDGSPVVDVRRYDDRASLERAIRLREIEAGVVIPGGIATAPVVASSIELLGQPTVAAPGGVRAAVEGAVAETAAALYVGDALDGSGSAAATLDLGLTELATAPRAADDEATEVSRFELQGAAASAILATLVLFVFTNTMAGGGSMVSELREWGILARARTSKATSRTLAAGIALMLASYALFQAFLILATGALLFDVQWFSPGPTLVALGLMALAAGGLGVLFGTVLPSSELSVTIGGPLGFFLAMVGGAVWPLDIVGPALQTIGKTMPHAWAIDALDRASIEGGGMTDIAAPLAVLAGAALLLVAVGGLRLYRITERS